MYRDSTGRGTKARVISAKTNQARLPSGLFEKLFPAMKLLNLRLRAAAHFLYVSILPTKTIAWEVE